MKNARYQFALAHQHWTLEDWKNVIFSDETSVLLGQRRGRIRVWRDAKERYHPDVIRGRWKGFSEFMFWGSFSYDHKGPCHVWRVETPAEKRAATECIVQLNKEMEQIRKEEWELRTSLRRLALRTKPA